MPVRSLFMILLLLVTCPVLAQTSVKGPDYLITNAGDTLRGKLRFSTFVTETGAQLAPGTGAEPRNFIPAQSRGFGTADGRRFVRRYLSFEAQKLSARAAVARVRAQDSIPVFLQVLVVGKAQLYQLDYHLVAERTPLEYAQFESRFLYLQVPGTDLRCLNEATFRPVLRGLLRDCPSLEAAIRDARFTPAGLAQVVLAYNTTCGAGFGAPRALPLAALVPESGQIFGRFGLRAGASLGTVQYPTSAYDAATGAVACRQFNWTVGLSAQLLGHGHWGLTSGLHLSARRNKVTRYQTVPAGFSNETEILVLRQRLAVYSAQVPLLLQFVPTLTTERARFFVNLGPVLGFNFRNTSTQDELATLFRPGQFISRQGTRSVPVNDREQQLWSPTIGAQAGTGVRVRLAARALVTELYYELGQEIRSNQRNDRLRYGGAGLRVGIDL